MITSELSSYIKSAREKKTSDEDIKSKLQSVGWKEEDIAAALVIDSGLPLPPPDGQAQGSAPTNPSGVKSPESMWDSFEYILMFIAMYVSAISLATILSYLIDQWFPPYNPYPSYGSYSNTSVPDYIYGFLSALIVSFPIFAFLFLNLMRRVQKNPLVKRMHSRRMLVYITLIVSFTILLFSVIFAVHTFLTGNISVNFLLHLLVAMGISGGIFLYFLGEVKDDRKV